MSGVPRRVPVLVSAVDDILRRGVRTTLHQNDRVSLVEEPQDALVAVLVVDRVDEQLSTLLVDVRQHNITRIVLITGDTNDTASLHALEAGVCAVVARADATSTVLGGVIKAAAAGQGVVSPALLGRLLERVAQLRNAPGAPRGESLGMTKREVEVFRMLADGMSTREVASALFLGERTIKDILSHVFERFGLNNRTHAMAYVIRKGYV